MSDQPTKEYVEKMIEVSQWVIQDGLMREKFNIIHRAYLAQGDELAAECIRYGKLAQLYRQQGEDMADVLKQRDQKGVV